jgi:hypothetical protein
MGWGRSGYEDEWTDRDAYVNRKTQTDTDRYTDRQQVVLTSLLKFFFSK